MALSSSLWRRRSYSLGVGVVRLAAHVRGTAVQIAGVNIRAVKTNGRGRGRGRGPV